MPNPTPVNSELIGQPGSRWEILTPALILDLIAGLSIIAHFMAISKGVFALTDVIYFVAMIGLWLSLTRLVLQAKSAD